MNQRIWVCEPKSFLFRGLRLTCCNWTLSLYSEICIVSAWESSKDLMQIFGQTIFIKSIEILAVNMGQTLIDSINIGRYLQWLSNTRSCNFALLFGVRQISFSINSLFSERTNELGWLGVQQMVPRFRNCIN